MIIKENYSLKEHNSFHIPVKTRWFAEYDNEDELCKFLHDEYFMECRSLHLGSGTNLLFVNDFDGIILHSKIGGIEIIEDTVTHVVIRVGASHLWDATVAFAVSHGLWGIENLTAIPGETGAAAVQNIGAYGAEIKDVIVAVEAFNQLTSEKRIFTVDECDYSYRQSVFKKSDLDPYIVTRVILRLQKEPVFNLSYGNLREVLSDVPPTLQSIRDAVIAVRRSKLPAPEELGNAGSFFINPITQVNVLEAIRNEYPSVPYYQVSDNQVKIPAGWLIEQCGFKGKRKGNTGVYEHQALVIVNYGGATGSEIADFAEEICSAVQQRFGIQLQPEVKFVQ